MNKRDVQDVATSLGVSVQLRRKKPTTKRNPNSRTKSYILKLIKDVDNRVESEDWGGVTPTILVGLYLWAYERVYKIDCIDEVRVDFKLAVYAVAKMLKNEFNNDTEVAIDFMRWGWGREDEHERYRIENNGGRGGRLTWHKMFINKKLLNEWKLEQVRKHGTA